MKNGHSFRRASLLIAVTSGLMRRAAREISLPIGFLPSPAFQPKPAGLSGHEHTSQDENGRASVKLLHFHLRQGFGGQAVAAVNGACRALAASSVAARKVRTGRAIKATEESMISVSLTFNRAAGAPDPVFNSFTFWMLVWAIAIDDDRQRREKERRRKRQAAAQPQRKPTPPPGPR